jgi:hypothetical protein
MAARARIEHDIQELGQAVGPLSNDDREFVARALAAKHDPNTGHSALDLAKTTFWHPVKVAEHVGPKGLIYDRLAQDRYLMERFPNLWGELVRFYSGSGSTPTVNVVTLFDYRFEKAPHEAYNIYKYLQAKRGQGERPERVAVTPSMFGDAPQGLEEASLLLGSFNVLAERVYLAREPGYEGGSQFKLVVTDSLGLQAGQTGYFKGLSNIVRCWRRPRPSASSFDRRSSRPLSRPPARRLSRACAARVQPRFPRAGWGGSRVVGGSC